MTMQELIERLEKATGADRETDVRIFWLTMTETMRAWFDSTGYVAKVVAREWDGGALLGLFYSSSDRPPDKFDIAPKYTSSIDAALTLVPEGWWPRHLCEVRTDIRYRSDRHEPTGKWRAEFQAYGGGQLTHGEGSSLALAVCVVALRLRTRLARASDGEKE